MPKQSASQQKTVERVMHEYKHKELKSGPGGKSGKVKSRKQAIAIALHEAGASKNESPSKNKKNLAKSKAKERAGKTYMQEKEGKAALKKLGRKTKKTTTRKAASRKKSGK